MTHQQNNLNIEWLTTSETNKNIKQLTFRLLFGFVAIIISVFSLLRLPYLGEFLDGVIFDLLLFGTAKYIFYLCLFLIGICFLIYTKRYWRLILTKRFILFFLLVMYTFALIFAIVNYFQMWNISSEMTINIFFTNFFQSWKKFSWVSGKWVWETAGVFINGNLLWTIFFALTSGVPAFILFIILVILIIIIALIVCVKLKVKKIEFLRKKCIVWMGGFYKQINNSIKQANVINEPNNDYTEATNISSDFATTINNTKPILIGNSDDYNYEIGLKQNTNNLPLTYETNSTVETFTFKNLSKKSINFYEEIQGSSENNYDKNYEFTKTSISNLNDLFSRLLIKGTIIDFNVGPSLISIETKFEKNEDINILAKNKKEIQNSLNVSNFDVYIKSDNKLYFQFQVPFPNKIHFNSLNQNIHTYNNQLNCVIGLNDKNKDLFISLIEYPTIFLIGAIGSGKGMLISSILLSLITHYSSTDLMLAIVDTRSSHLSKFEREPHLVSSISNNANDAFILLDKILAELKYRINLIKNNNVNSIDKYNETKSNKEQIKPLVIVINDVQDLIHKNKEYLFKFINTISNHAKVLNCYMILLSDEMNDDLFKIKFNLCFGFKLPSDLDSNIPIYKNYLSKLYGNGDFIMFDDINNPKWIHRGQSCFISSIDLTKVLSSLQKQMSQNN
ncbi:FtsK/SpoIIIE domain-containing protein [Mycoplasmoides alvi]|uniref:FtsK/SpoIIIE domain-containing protein n=1 Tax=Mycoplasmoides alvi TaxID=78580 RepID=UPI00051BBD01|nr:FtsK/SpoIIIE domain-containing protein [Mycoplasmoides alvi]